MSDLEKVIKDAAQKAARDEVRRLFGAVITFVGEVEHGAPYPQPVPMPMKPTEQKPRNKDRTRKEVEAQMKMDIEAGKLVPIKASDFEGRGGDVCCSDGKDCCE